MGSIKRAYDWDWTGADAAYKRALELEPANADILRSAARLAGSLGRFDEAIRLSRDAIALDPLQVGIYANLGLLNYYAGRWQDGKQAIHKALELNRQFPAAYSVLGKIHLEQSKPQQALAEMQKETDPSFHSQGLALAYRAMGMDQEADSVLADYIKQFADGSAKQLPGSLFLRIKIR